ncbi:MAG: hypothetical protein Athens071412_422 [Parcubacteria group bacterium Athens0714_12]|nr:MAG: hypothetical protein Athens071412_422 [Parcubacteria group bacterium Athens0714_12]
MEITALVVLLVVIIFFVYKNFLEKNFVYEKAEKIGFIESPQTELYPPFSIKISDVLNNSKFNSLKVFSRLIEDSGLAGNPNPFVPFK